MISMHTQTGGVGTHEGWGPQPAGGKQGSPHCPLWGEGAQRASGQSLGLSSRPVPAAVLKWSPCEGRPLAPHPKLSLGACPQCWASSPGTGSSLLSN